MSAVCNVRPLLCLPFFYVRGLLCPPFVMSIVCYIRCLLCPPFVMSAVCYVCPLLCLVFVMSAVCYVRRLLFRPFVSGVCYVHCLSVLGLSCLVFVCPGFDILPNYEYQKKDWERDTEFFKVRQKQYVASYWDMWKKSAILRLQMYFYIISHMKKKVYKKKEIVG